ncbi:hypothetical protein N7490_009706 [Penicillium lividum]|nr:hypothetical protein N7490_009706 [Penicillium lividum]
MPKHPFIERFSASHQVLTSSSLLEQIFTWIYEDIDGWWAVPEVSEKNSPEEITDSTDEDSRPYIERGGVLLCCALVSKQWFYEAARVLWRNWDDNRFYGSVFTETFQRIEPIRRQLYANMIHRATILLVEEEDLFQVVRNTFESVIFPNLKTVHLYVPGSCNYKTHRVELPIFHAPQLAILLIDPQYDLLPVSYAVSQDEWKTLFELITVRFPEIKTIDFLDHAKVWPGELQKLKDRLLHLEQLNVQRVVESMVKGRDA